MSIDDLLFVDHQQSRVSLANPAAATTYTTPTVSSSRINLAEDDHSYRNFESRIIGVDREFADYKILVYSSNLHSMHSNEDVQHR